LNPDLSGYLSYRGAVPVCNQRPVTLDTRGYIQKLRVRQSSQRPAPTFPGNLMQILNLIQSPKPDQKLAFELLLISTILTWLARTASGEHLSGGA